MTTREVTIEGGSPWGFRMHGGADVQQPLKISRVNPGSKAALKGIREGDVISSINGESTKDKTNAEAHQLLKSSGDLLKLGLNEDGGSPKKRQFRTVQQETHSETVKRTNATTQIVTTTTKQKTHHRTESGKSESNEKGLEGKSGQVNGANDHLQGQDCFSEKSTISSNYSSTVSTPLTETNSQGSRAKEEEMPKRRKRNGGNKKKAKANGEPTSKAAEDYRVESPKTVKEEKKVVKSRSLDDDDASIKIQEISSECGTNPNQTEPNPTQVIIEPIEDQKESVHKMNTETLKIDQPNATRISPEDESNLRSFLQTLHLPATPEDALNEKESAETIKAKRAKKREELAQYFLPVYQNPRYLDVISEENSDHSDKEGKDKTEVKKPKIQRYIPKVPYHNPNQKKVETVMIETGDIETPIISTTCTVSMMEQSSGGVEVVFLDEESQSEDEDDELNEDGDVLSSQLTPPPTPDNLSPKQIEITQIDQQTPSQPLQKSSALSPTLPSRSPSHDREDSSSRGTSLCTTICVNLELKSLRELCLDKLISLPFGKEVLEELANVSKSLQELTNNLATEQKQPETNACDFGIAEKGEMDQADAWVGIRTEDDPQVVVCFSPTQKEYLDTTKSFPREADKLLDLHKKFIERSYYSDTEILEPTESFKGDSRLLPFIHEFKPIKPVQNHENPRLHAKNLHEWLQLARSNKSTSELNLSVIGENHYHQKRRKSLPNELYIQQMQSIIQKEKEIQHELEKLEEEKRKLQNEMTAEETQQNNYKFDPTKYHISKNEDIAIHTEELKRPILKPTQPSTEKFRKQMFDEYMQEIAERNERKHQKVIKVSNHQDIETAKDTRQSRGIEEEFMTKLKQKRYCHRSSEEKDELNGESERDESQVKVITCGKPISDTKKLPKHLKEFVDITREASENLHVDGDPDEGCGIWTPGRRDSFSSDDLHHQQSADLQDGGKPEDPIAPVWTPKSAGSSPQPERKEFRPLNFTSPVLGRKNKPNGQQRADEGDIEPPWRGADVLSAHLGKRIPNSHSAPPSGFGDLSQAPRLPRAQNPTITLLQKAREGQIPKGASYIEDPPLPPKKRESPPKISPGEIVYEIKHEYTSESENEKPRKIADLGPRKITGIGPTTREGMPLTLRSEVRDQNQSRWYKKMYDTIHKQRPRYDDDYVTIRYKHRRGNYPYTSGYVSEPEPGAYDSDTGYYHSNINHSTLDRRRTMDSKGDTFTATYTVPRTIGTSRTMQSDVIKHGKDSYKNQPGRIENYIPGHSSISEKEAKEWWDEVMDIFDGHLEQQKHIPSKGYMSQALKESGYESDSTLVFRRRDDALNQLSSSEHREAYKTIQKGGDVPLHGLRKPAPERPKEPEAPVPPPKGSRRKAEYQESPRKYVENEVTIHYKTPVRQEVKEAVSEDELQRRQAEHMKKVYQEERRRKYLQVSHSVDALNELQDMNNRRHTDNFIPSQKSPIPLNRYDDFLDDYSPKVQPRPRSPEARLVAKALYNFLGQTARELTFRKGDVIYIRRQIDKNWYEGEHNAMVGLFPANYVEILPHEGPKATIRKPHEGQARAKYNFIAQTHLELSLAKGETVVVTRRVDDNWFEGKVGARKGIFPVSYVEVLVEPGDSSSARQPSKPVAAPASHSLMVNGKESMGAHSYVPQSQAASASYRAKPVQVSGSSDRGHGTVGNRKNPLSQELHVDTQSEPYVPYRALYKYKPQNEDEIELNEGDTVYVLEKCDDGWFVGASERTGALGTFPGNYVERI